MMDDLEPVLKSRALGLFLFPGGLLCRYFSLRYLLFDAFNKHYSAYPMSIFGAMIMVVAAKAAWRIARLTGRQYLYFVVCLIGIF